MTSKSSPEQADKIVWWLGIIFFIIVILIILLQSHRQSPTGEPSVSVTDSIWSQNPDRLTFHQEYPMISENNPYRYLTIDQTLDFLNPQSQKTGVIYFGFPNCPWCQNALPVLTQVAQEEELPTIYYYNAQSIKTPPTPEYDQLRLYLADHLSTNEDGEPWLYVPDIYFLNQGQIVGHHLSTLDSQEDPSQPLSTEQTQELADIYRQLMQSLDFDQISSTLPAGEIDLSLTSSCPIDSGDCL